MIRHIRKDGTVLADIQGLTVTKEQNGELYALLQRKGEQYERFIRRHERTRMAEA